MAKEAACIKAFKKMLYTDCFSTALAKMAKGELVTGDPEFKQVEKDIKRDTKLRKLINFHRPCLKK